jgi:phage antirepressor YoqD-like protein
MNELVNLREIKKEGQRVLTTQQLAEAYGVEAKKLSYNFKYNEQRYAEGKHFYKLVGDELREFKRIEQGKSGNSRLVENGYEQGYETNCRIVDDSAPSLYLWTERGALLHAKSLNTDKAWEVYDNLVEFYFAKKEEAQYRLPQTRKEALIELVAEIDKNERLVAEKEQLQLENATQAQALIEAQPAKDFMEAVNSAHNSITVSDFAKAIGVENMGRNNLFKWLKDEGYLMYGNKPYQKYLDLGVFEVVEKVADTGYEMRVYTQTLVTPKGQTYLFNKLRKGMFTLETACLDLAKDKAQRMLGKERLCGTK